MLNAEMYQVMIKKSECVCLDVGHKRLICHLGLHDSG